MRLRSDIQFLDILGHGILWLLLSILTLGISMFFYPYSFSKFIINRTEVIVDEVPHALYCDIDIVSQIGHIVLWFLLSLLTLGIAYFFYVYKVWNFALNNTAVVRR